MRIALPIAETRVATVFDFADKMTIADIVGMRVSSRQDVQIPEPLPSIRVGRLRELNVNTLICGAISNMLAAMVWHSGIEVVPGITGEVEAVLDAFMNGRLAGAQYSLPGAGQTGRCGWWHGRGRRFRGGRGRR